MNGFRSIRNHTQIYIATYGLSAGPGTSIFNWTDRRQEAMSLEMDHDCPECSNDRFWRTASTTLHLGEKTKWACTDCDYRLIRIGDIDSSAH